MAFKQLGALDVDGTTNATSTNLTVYTVPTGKQTVVSTAHILNRNTTNNAKIRIFHVPSGGSTEVKYAILYDREIVAGGNYISIQLGITMAEGDSIVFYSDTTEVNIILWGDEK